MTTQVRRCTTTRPQRKRGMWGDAPELERMKPERDQPGAREGTEIFMRFCVPHTDVATRFVHEDFRFPRRDRAPRGIAALRCDKIGMLWKRIENSDGRVRGEIRREKSEVHIRFAIGQLRESLPQPRMIRATPVGAVMKQGHRGMQLGEEPLVFAARHVLGRMGRQLQIGRGISVFVELWIIEILAHEAAIGCGQFVFRFVRVRFDHVAEGRLDFLKREMRQHDQTRPGQRKARGLAGAQKRG